MNERILFVLNELLNLDYTNVEVGVNYISRTNVMSTEEIADKLEERHGRFFCPDGDRDLGTWDSIQTNYIYVYAREEDTETLIKHNPDFFSIPVADGDQWIFIFA